MTSPSPSELAAQLKKLGFRVLPDQLEDFLGRAKNPGKVATRSERSDAGDFMMCQVAVLSQCNFDRLAL